jgi:hypothetical protein
MIIVTHVEKTAGTSFRHYLAEVFGDRLLQDYPALPRPPLPRWRRLLIRLGCERAAFPARLACIIGHFDATHYERLFRNAAHAIWLRDPVDRVLSHYFYNRRHPEWVEGDWSNTTLAEFVETESERNRQTKRLAGKPLSAFAFVGVTEQYEASTKLFAHMFRLPPPQEMRRMNFNPERLQQHYALTPEFRRRVQELNRDDVDLYVRGFARFQELCRQHGVGLAEPPLLSGTA